MALTAPDWLTKRDGSLRPGVDGRSWFFYFAKEPQYELTPVPVQGKHGVDIRQTINGRHLEHKNTYASAEEALRGGLEALRQRLGW
jgi:hypothetical protein